MSMDIQSVRHQSNGGYIVNGNVGVPEEPGNRDYREVQEWILEGNTPAPPLPEPAPEPSELDIVKDVLRSSGILTPAKLENARIRLLQKAAE